jgi:hypothetical protein
MMILDTLVQKFGTLRHYVVLVSANEDDKMSKKLKKEENHSEELYRSLYPNGEVISDTNLAEGTDGRENKAGGDKKGDKSLSGAITDSMHDIKSLVKVRTSCCMYT